MNTARARRHEEWVKENYLPGLEKDLADREKALKEKEADWQREFEGKLTQHNERAAELNTLKESLTKVEEDLNRRSEELLEREEKLSARAEELKQFEAVLDKRAEGLVVAVEAPAS